MSREGTLSLLQIGASHMIFLFDIASLGSKPFDLGLKEILEGG